MELLTLGIQACFIIWAAALLCLAIRETRRALAARRRRRAYWQDLLRSAREATAHLPPPPPIRWHDGPDDHYLADPDGGGAWVQHE